MPNNKNQPQPVGTKTADEIKTPLDPTDDANSMMGDTRGLTGISNDNYDQSTPPQDTGPASRTMSDARYDFNTGNSGEADSESSFSETNDNMSSQNQDSGIKNPSPDETGEMSISGDMPDPSSDNDTLENSHEVGLRLDEDSEHPKELDIASDIDKAEEYKRTH